MTLDRLRPAADRATAPLVRAALAVGLTPDAVSVLAFVLAAAAGGAFALGTRAGHLVGALLVVSNGLLDVVDGDLARELGTESAAGDLLDHVLDRYADVAVVTGAAAGVGSWALGLAAVTGVLLTSYLGTQIEAVGLEREYGGLLGRADRLALLAVAGVLAAWMPAVAGYSPVAYLLVLFAVVGHVTAVQRFLGAWRALS